MTVSALLFAGCGQSQDEARRSPETAPASPTTGAPSDVGPTVPTTPSDDETLTNAQQVFETPCRIGELNSSDHVIAAGRNVVYLSSGVTWTTGLSLEYGVDEITVRPFLRTNPVMTEFRAPTGPLESARVATAPLEDTSRDFSTITFNPDAPEPEQSPMASFLRLYAIDEQVHVQLVCGDAATLGGQADSLRQQFEQAEPEPLRIGTVS